MKKEKEKSKQWVSQNGEYNLGEIPAVHDLLPVGIYELNINPKTGFYLSKISDKFVLPEKIYGIEKDFIKRIITTYNSIDKNFGVLLQGLKGTGKTVVAKEVCNQLNLPVILVNSAFGDMGNFLNSIEQNVIILFDEFEKVYDFYASSDEDDFDDGSSGKAQVKKSISNLLTLMDGVFTSKYKRLFLLTTNKDSLPDPMLSRPSRIRYIKEFTDLNYESIMEILNDSVENKKLIPGLSKILSGLDVITVDIVKSLAEEANIYNTDEPGFYSIFNAKLKKNYYDVYIEDEDEPIETRFQINFSHYRKNASIYIGEYYFIIKSVHADEKYFTVIDGHVPVKEAKKKKLSFKPHKYIHKSMNMNMFEIAM